MGIFLVFANLSQGVSRFGAIGGVLQLLRRPIGEVELVSVRRVTTHFRVGLVSADRLDFVMGASRLGQTPGTRLAQTVR